MRTFEVQRRLIGTLLEPLPLEERLARALAQLCRNPWPGLAPRAAVFLQEGGRLRLAAAYGLEPEERARCDAAGPGSCACGPDPESGARQGHATFPIPAGNAPVGVLHLCLAPGEELGAATRGFLEETARLVGLVVRHEQTARAHRRADRARRVLLRALEAALGAESWSGFARSLTETLVDAGGYPLAAVWTRGRGAALDFVAGAGDALEYARSIKVTLDDAPTGRGPGGRALKEGRPVVLQNALEDPTFAPWRPTAERYGLRANAAFPFAVEGRPVGVLSVYAGEADAFEGEELEMLERVAQLLGEVKVRLETGERLELFRAVIEQIPESILITDTEGRIEFANRTFVAETGYALEEVLGRNPRILKSNRHSPSFYRSLWQALKAGRTFRATFVNRRKTGELYPSDRLIAPVRARGKEYYVAFGRDTGAEERTKAELTAVLDALPQPVIMVDLAGRLLRFNRAAARVFELKDEHRGRPVPLLHPQGPEGFLKRLEQLRRGGEVPPLHFQWQGRSFRVHPQPVRGLGQEPAGVVAVFVDVTDLEKEAAFRHALLRLMQHVVEAEDPYKLVLDFALEQVPGADAGSLMIREESGDLLFVALRGHPPDLLHQRLPSHAQWPIPKNKVGIFRLSAEAHRRSKARHPKLYAAANTAEIREVLYVPIALEGQEELVLNLDAFRTNAFSERDLERMDLLAGALGFFLGWKKQKDQAAYLAYHDALTGLPNRRFFVELGSKLIARADRGEPAALLMVDVDRLKTYNDTLGHPAGDVLLKEVARRLKAALFDGDVVLRLGGDEFAAVLRGCDAGGAEKATRRILEAMAAPVQVEGRVLQPSITLGVAVAPGDGTSLPELLHKADLALLRAREEGRALAFFDAELEAARSAERELEIELKSALTGGGLDLVVQPILDLRDGSYAHFEVLLRWKEPPARFIALAERVGLGPALDAYVLDRAEALARRLGKPVFVNLLPSTLAVGVPQRPDPRWVGFEVTEHGVLKPEAHAHARELAAEGFALALDDFGTGYASLNLLYDFPLHLIKLDRGLILRALEQDDAKARALLEGLVPAMSGMGLEVLAEGVEDERHLAYLASIGVRYAQGYGIARPAPPENFSG
ncbi:diguanylate cyclase/phosphodiesterase with PAS/PAC and GAF sensor(s) [Oceanithermus profundus DSM 14977]|uniref:Diguanylate cyclase/phosphodiesterase with PAS/PAC and GAF sensor(S) n=1 Tax=Oceanithermus profundus (strain DSM 14977 / NBRC 100410 / VKM B-2274 / 506) TaxID=670487 RepID=E4U5L7_OCEP5|nr:EAL domain-containing protein [Oceanithermus profundus]ADR35575.1 diguanylate cyclase/phosphodiesterase with PAS/PAC and GAF sensor(s) [Oceanithermus profundus DSM 14977]